MAAFIAQPLADQDAHFSMRIGGSDCRINAEKSLGGSFESGSAFISPHDREEKNIADGRSLSEQHHKPVDADAKTASWRHALTDGFNELFIKRMGFFIASIFFIILINEEGSLEFWIIELGVGIAHFAAENKTFKPLDKLFFAQFRIAMEFAQRCRFNRMVNDVVRLNEMLFSKLFKQFCNEDTPRS